MATSEHDQPTRPIPTMGEGFPPPPPPRRRGRSRLAVVVVAGGVGLLLIAALWAWRGASAPQPSAVSPSPVATNPAPSPSIPASPAPGSTYTIAPGDTMKGIAQKVYGDPEAWPRIYEANRDAIGPDPDALRVGSDLRIPPR